ncbi:MAG TPA: dihydrofolate reductase [Candidatus Omnitrophota bacterium]|nr:dihydrofolate reductase [Candidatus Omnitrophota bacterium]
MILIHLIVALDKNYGIGQKGRLPWRLSEDLKYFKKITTTASKNKKNAVIMGRKTWESLPGHFRPLPDRVNIVLTKNNELTFPEGVEKAESFSHVFELLETVYKEKVDKAFVIGGAEIYRQAIDLPQLRTIYMTHILEDFSCDVFFPLRERAFQNDFKRIEFTSVFSENETTFYFAQYQRR